MTERMKIALDTSAVLAIAGVGKHHRMSATDAAALVNHLVSTRIDLMIPSPVVAELHAGDSTSVEFVTRLMAARCLTLSKGAAKKAGELRRVLVAANPTLATDHSGITKEMAKFDDLIIALVVENQPRFLLTTDEQMQRRGNDLKLADVTFCTPREFLISQVAGGQTALF
jgi:predicted nucleic acid-binding protein